MRTREVENDSRSQGRNSGLEAETVRHAAPTLAGMKAANLFGYRYSSWEALQQEAENLSGKLLGKGIRVRIFLNEVSEERSERSETEDAGDDFPEESGRKKEERRALVYIYRERDLHFILEQEENQEFLFGLGYLFMNDDEALEELGRRIGHCGRADDCFPHEIGLFLGYPLADVLGFMADRGEHCSCSGIWKCYGEPEQARKYFRKISRCADIYRRVYDDGRSIEQLTVAS